MGTRVIGATIDLKDPNASVNRYITRITDAGITIHPENMSNNNYIQLDGTGLDILQNNISVANFGSNVRVGMNTSNHVDINSAGIYFKDNNNTSVASFTMDSGVSLGNENGYHIFIDGNIGHTNTYGLGFYEDYHGTIEYILTTDREVVFNKEYYKLISGSYVKIENPTGDPMAQGWYEIKDRRIAYINNRKLYIPYTVVLKGMDLGDYWRWELQKDTKNLTLVWLGQ